MPGQDQHDYGRLRSHVDQNGPRGLRGAGLKGVDQRVGGRRDIVQIFMIQAQTNNPLTDVALLAKRDPELLPIFSGPLDADKVINDAALTDAPEPDSFFLDQLLDLALGRQRHVDDLGGGQVLRKHQRDGRRAERIQGGEQMRLDLLGGHQALGFEIQRLFMHDSETAKTSLGQQQSEATAARVHGRHAPDRRAEAGRH